MNMRYSAGLLVLLASFTATGLAVAAWDAKRERAALETIEEFRDTNKKMARLFNDAYGYAVFPNVGKGGFGIGGAYGKGIAFENGIAIGTTKLYQVSLGFQFGGQAYSEIVFFEHKTAMGKFKAGNFKLGAQASAVAVTAGASADASFHNGVAIFTLIKGGLMYEASVSGQKFNFYPREGAFVTAAAPAAQPGKDNLSATARYESAKLAFAAGRYEEARSKWVESARQGHVESLYELGKMFGEGQGVLQDFVTAHAYFNVAAAKGHKQAVQARQILDDMMSNEERAEARKRATEYWQTFGK
jgi:lipid-binding SYLF domain-containing protein